MSCVCRGAGLVIVEVREEVNNAVKAHQAKNKAGVQDCHKGRCTKKINDKHEGV